MSGDQGDTWTEAVKSHFAAASAPPSNKSKPSALLTSGTSDVTSINTPNSVSSLADHYAPTPSASPVAASPLVPRYHATSVPLTGHYSKMEAWHTANLDPWTPLDMSHLPGPSRGLTSELEDELELLLKQAGEGKQKGAAPKL